jgi:alpha-glucosidase
MKYFCTSLTFIVISITAGFCQTQLKLQSPEKKLVIRLFIANKGQLRYQLNTQAGAMLVEPSRLGIQAGSEILGEHTVAIKLTEQKIVKQSYPITGKHAMANTVSIAYTISITGGNTPFHLLLRVFDNGFAFRYDLSGISSKLIKGELSSFKIPVSSTVWFFERKNSWKLRSYAGEWMSADINRMATISPNGPIQGKPLTIKLKDGHYLLLTEAALYGYSGMRLMMNNEGAFQANFTEDEFTRTVDKTPWRVVLVADDFNQLVNSDIISSLNPAPDKTLFPDISYIKPGRCVWSWITRDSNYMKPVNEKHFIDMAAKLNFEYSFIDDGWETAWPQKWRQLKELCDYGKQKNVQLWVWKDSKYIRDSSARVEFLDSVKKAGVAGIKVDFMNSEAAELVDFDISLLKECAARQLIVDLHGCQAPSGEERTYPNQLTREGIRGLELNGMAEGPITASHNAALPFTRFVVGPGDYTPGLFSKPGKTTWAQQLACMYLFDSPLFCLAKNPKYILDDPNLRQIVPFLKELP